MERSRPMILKRRLICVGICALSLAAGCIGTEPSEDDDVLDEETEAAAQALVINTVPLSGTGGNAVFCWNGPYAEFTFQGHATSYFMPVSSGPAFVWEYNCGNGTTDVCGPVQVSPFAPGTGWLSHVVQSDNPIIYHAGGCW